MLKELLIPAILMSASPTEQVQPRYLIDYEDTTSFETAWELTHEDSYSLGYAEVFGIGDDYDYIKYTAPYTRCVLFVVSTPETLGIVNVEVFLPEKSTTIPFATYNSNTIDDPMNTIPVEQGETVYCRIQCNGNIWWEVTLDTKPLMIGAAYHEYERFYGYDMPYTQGGVVIKYKYDDSCYTTVPGQNYTYREVFIDATEVWEGVGQINFVESSTDAWFTVSMEEREYLEVYTQRKIIGNTYHCSEIEFPSDYQHYHSIYYGMTTWYGTPVTPYQAILGEGVHAFGLALGLVNWDDDDYTSFNHMTFMPKPFLGLGDGDIYSFIELWGDANGDIY